MLTQFKLQSPSFDEFRYFTSVNEITPGSFKGCINLRSVIIPPDCTWLNMEAFHSSGLESIVIPKNIESIWQNAFSSCLDLKKVVFADDAKLRSLRWSVFSDCVSLEEIYLPDTLMEKGNNSFAQCTSLRKVHYPTNESITEITDNEFSGCSSLIEIRLTPYITKIGTSAFHKSGLQGHIDLSNIKSIGAYAFRVNMKLESVNIMGSTEIPTECFIDNTSLQTVEWDNKKMRIVKAGAFKNCSALTNINLDLSECDGLVLGDRSFCNCTNINTQLILPQNCTVDYGCFLNAGITGKLVLPSGLKWNSGSVFSGTGIESLVFEEGICTVKPSSFTLCKQLKTIVLPSTITLIDNRPFHEDEKIEWFVCKAIIPPTMTDNLGYIPHTWKLYVPDESVKAYKTNIAWSQYASKICPLSQREE